MSAYRGSHGRCTPTFVSSLLIISVASAGGGGGGGIDIGDDDEYDAAAHGACWCGQSTLAATRAASPIYALL